MTESSKIDELEQRVAELEQLLRSSTYPFRKCPQCGSLNIERTPASPEKQRIANSYNQVLVQNRCKDCAWEWYKHVSMSDA
jgi:hypothetical protein